MLRDELLMPALSMLPQGGWLNSDNAIKPLTSQAWEMVEMYAEEYAARVISPREKTQMINHWDESAVRFFFEIVYSF